MTLRWTLDDVDACRIRRNAEAGCRTGTVVSGGRVETTLAIRLTSTANLRAHPLRIWRLGKTQANAVAKALPGRILPPLPVTVTITRIGHRTLDTDNLAISAKAVRDAIARQYGVDDGDPRYTWEYAQEKAKPGVHACRITIASKGELRVTPA